MASVKRLLDVKVEPRREVVAFDGEEYALAGMSDSYILELQMMEENKQVSRAGLYTTHLQLRGTPGVFTKEEVFPIMVVAHYIEQDPEDPVTDVDIAILSKERGLLFTQLFAAALKIIGGTSDAQLTPIEAAGLGKSDKKARATK